MTGCGQGKIDPPARGCPVRPKYIKIRKGIKLMRENRMLRMAAVLTVCVLLTTSVISGTYAKYATVAEVSDSARVAKWGVAFTATSDLFAKAYKDTAVGDTDNTATVKVTATDTSNLVAPGTEGAGLNISVAGDKKPEVSYDMTIGLGTDSKMPKLTYTPATGSADPYEPVKFSILDENTVLKEMTFSQLKNLCDGTKPIYTYDVAADKYYVDKNCDGTIDASEKAAASNTPPKINIKWKWAINAGTTADAKLCTKLDTILGDIAAEIDVTNASYKLPDGVSAVDAANSNTAVVLDWTMTAAQID